MKKYLKSLMKNKIMFILITLFITFLTFGTFYLFYVVSLLSNIANEIRFLINTIILFLWYLLILFSIRVLKKNKKVKYTILMTFILLYSIVLTFVSFTAHNLYSKFSQISTNSTTYSSSLVTLKSNSVSDIKGISTEKIGIYNDTTDLEGNIIPNEIIKKENLSNELVEYSDYVSLIQDLNSGTIKYAFLPTNYTAKFASIEDLNLSNIKILYSLAKDVEVETSSSNEITEPFTILLMGVDSETNEIKNSSVNGDSLILITFNPKTLNSTILSIPRDTYTNISCFAGKRKNKITHAAWYGEECMQSTIENLLDIKIDYFVKINFKGVVKLVDALGGIEVDVPIKFCEQDSNRNFDNLICLNKGVQTLNGEQALALSRHRKTINDFIRGQNQQLVIKGMTNKLISVRSLDTISKLLDTIKENMETNMSTNQIFSLYDVALKIVDSSSTNDALNMQRLYISGYDQYIFDYSNIYSVGMKLNLYNFVPYDGSLDDVKTAMKTNLGIEANTTIKNFNFDINKPYVETIIGKGNNKITSSINLLPNFVGKDKSIALNYGYSKNIVIKIESVSGNSNNFIGQVISQSIPANVDMEYNNFNNGITIKVVTSIANAQTNINTNTTNNNENTNTNATDTNTTDTIDNNINN